MSLLMTIMAEMEGRRQAKICPKNQRIRVWMVKTTAGRGMRKHNSSQAEKYRFLIEGTRCILSGNTEESLHVIEIVRKEQPPCQRS